MLIEKPHYPKKFRHGGVDLNRDLKTIFILICIIGLPILTKAKESVEDPDLNLFGLLMDKDFLTFEEENSLYEELESDLTKLACTGSVKLDFNYANGYSAEDEIPEKIEYFAFNDQYFFKKYSSKWIILDELQNNESSFEWSYNRVNKPLGNKDISFLSEDFNSELHLGSVSERLFINRETGYFNSNLSAYYIFPNEEVPDFEYVQSSTGTCKLPDKNKF